MTLSQRRQSKHFRSNSVPSSIEASCVRPGGSLKLRVSQAQKTWVGGRQQETHRNQERMASNCSEWRVLNKLVCLGKDKCHFFSLMCGQNSEERAPGPVSFHTPCPCPPQRSTITTCKSWGRVPNSRRPCMKGRARPKPPEWARWRVGLRSHPAPPTPGFGAKDLYMTPPGQPRAA